MRCRGCNVGWVMELWVCRVHQAFTPVVVPCKGGSDGRSVKWSGNGVGIYGTMGRVGRSGSRSGVRDVISPINDATGLVGVEGQLLSSN